MSELLRWAVYRDSMRGPSYLGDVLAIDRDAAVRAGGQTFGGAVVAHRTSKPGAVSPLLERAVRSAERRRGVSKAYSRARRDRGVADA